MNLRIRELAEQAGFTTNEANITVGNYQDGGEYFYAEDFIEDELKKFAELIVARMLDIVEAHSEIFQTDHDRAVIDHIKQSVKTDFGVND